jgi:hypothetical protein
MIAVIPEGETLRKAVKWISEVRSEKGGSLQKIIEEAAYRFDLSPLDADFLARFFQKEGEKRKTVSTTNENG